MRTPVPLRISAASLSLALVLGASLAGCFAYHHPEPQGPSVAPPPAASRGHGPPPHAPAHGYRRKHAPDGVELVYDAGVQVYVVMGREAVYWDGDRYLRWANGAWQASVRIDGVWVGIGSHQVPPALAARYTGRRG